MPGSFTDNASGLQWGALLVSVVLHLAIFVAYAKMDLPATRSQLHQPVNAQPRIFAELITQVPRQPEVPSTAPTPASDDTQEDIVSADEPDADALQSDESVDEFVEAESLAEPPKIIDYALPSTTPEASLGTQDAGPQSGTFGQVFDPRLRQRLQSNRMHTSTAKPDSLQSTRDIHGDLHVDLGNGGCLMAKQTLRPGEPANWYMTQCNSAGGESEQMLRRVEQNWRKRGE